MEELGHVDRADVPVIADVLNLSVAEVHGVVTFYHDFRTTPPAAHVVAPVPRRGLPGRRCRGRCSTPPTRPRRGLGGGRRGARGVLPGQLRARPVRHRRRPPARSAGRRRLDALTAGWRRVTIVLRARRRRRRVGRRRRRWPPPSRPDGVARRAQRVARPAVGSSRWSRSTPTRPGRLRQRRPPTRRRAVLAGDLADIRTVRGPSTSTPGCAASSGSPSPGSAWSTPRRSPTTRHMAGWAGLRAERCPCSPAEVVAEVTESGLRGRGGAGFPAGREVADGAGPAADQKFVCCNFDEGDSGTFADRMLAEGDPFTLVEGMVIAGVRRRRDARATSTSARSTRTPSPRCGARSTRRTPTATSARTSWAAACAFDLHVRVGAGAYICGEESSMLESLEGKRGEVRARPPIPAITGLFGRPTVVNNVLTLGDGADDPGRRRCGVRRARHRPLPRHPGVPARPATSGAGASSSCRSGSPSASWSRSTAVAPAPADRCGRSRSVGRSGAYLPAVQVRPADGLRGLRGRRRDGRPRRHRGVRRHRRHGPDGPVRDGVLRGGVLRQVHARAGSGRCAASETLDRIIAGQRRRRPTSSCSTTCARP